MGGKGGMRLPSLHSTVLEKVAKWLDARRLDILVLLQIQREIEERVRVAAVPPAFAQVIQKRAFRELGGVFELGKVILAIEKPAWRALHVDTNPQIVLQRFESDGSHITISRRIPLRVKKPGVLDELPLIFSKCPHAIFQILLPKKSLLLAYDN
jgi:hypothetical protein